MAGAHQSTSSTFSTASGTKTTTLGALAAGEMVYVVVANTGSAALPTVTDDNTDGLGAYTAIAGPILKAASADRMYIFARNALVGTTASTIITMAPGATSGGGLSASRWTGMTQVGAAAIVSGQIGKQDNQAAATPAPALPSAATTTNPTIGAVFNGTNPATMTPNASWTERTDVGYNTPTSGLEVATRDSGFTGTTVTWGSASASAFCSLIIELDASAGADQNLTGSLFTKAPTFFTGTLSAVYDLTGTLFTRAPTFPQGAITAEATLSGVLFQRAPTFFTGTITAEGGEQTLAGTLFQKAPTFPTGTILGAYELSGTLFTKAPTFPQGSVTPGAVTLNGVLFQKAPAFFTGTVATEAGLQTLTGILFTKAPTFPTGTLQAEYTLSGVLFTKAPTFPQGAVSPGAVTLNGVLLTKAPMFFTGTVDLAGGTQALTGVLFQRAATFPQGLVSLGDLATPVKGPTRKLPYAGQLGINDDLFILVDDPNVDVDGTAYIGALFFPPIYGEQRELENLNGDGAPRAVMTGSGRNDLTEV